MGEPVLLVSDDSGVRVLCMNRPSSKNSLDSELVTRLVEALEAAAKTPSVRALILTGTGGAFCSGVDLKSAREDLDAPQRLALRLDAFHAVIRAITGLAVPVLAAVDGPAVGFGADLALACDLRLLSTSAYFEEKFVALGLMPDGGATFHLPRLIGLGRALDALLLGTRIDAEKALELGLASRVVEPSALRDEALSLGRKLAAGPPLALAAIKRATRASLEGSFESALERERTGQLALLASSDFREGLSAFFERRPPKFDGG
jgi:enoyl-CoA hydratase/carnithine racemase